MTNIDDFINWWRGFRDGIGSANITQEHLNMIDRKINGLQELWDISLPSKEEQEDVYPPQLVGLIGVMVGLMFHHFNFPKLHQIPAHAYQTFGVEKINNIHE